MVWRYHAKRFGFISWSTYVAFLHLGATDFYCDDGASLVTINTFWRISQFGVTFGDWFLSNNCAKSLQLDTFQITSDYFIRKLVRFVTRKIISSWRLNAFLLSVIFGSSLLLLIPGGLLDLIVRLNLLADEIWQGCLVKQKPNTILTISCGLWCRRST